VQLKVERKLRHVRLGRGGEAIIAFVVLVAHCEHAARRELSLGETFRVLWRKKTVAE